MWLTPKRAAAVVGVLLLSLWGCPADRSAGDTAPAAERTQLAPEQQMQTALQQVVDAQARHFEDHGRYADSLQTLIDDYGYQPVGEEQVALSFAERETDPQWGYVATAVHPFSNQECEVLHGTTRDGRRFAGQIVCGGPPTDPPQPDEAPPAGAPIQPSSEPQPVAPGQGPDAERQLPRTELDTLPPGARRP